MTASKPTSDLFTAVRDAVEAAAYWHPDFSTARAALDGIEEQYEGLLAEWRDYRATTEDVIDSLKEQLEPQCRGQGSGGRGADGSLLPGTQSS